MNKIRDKKISEFLKELSSKNPTPGGGSVAALSGSLAASLCEMVANLTKGDFGGVIKKTEDLRKRFLILADEDCKAFSAVMSAYKSKNKDKVQTALKKAAEVPFETAKLSDETKVIASMLMKKGNKNAYSDAKSAYYLAEASRKSAVENVKINLKYIKDEKWKRKLTK